MFARLWQSKKLSALTRQGVLTLSVCVRCMRNSLERFGCCIRAHQAGNHDCRGNTQTLVREIDQLNWLLASQLLDLERVNVNTANKEMKALKGADVVNHSHLLAEGTNGELQANGVAYLTLVSAVFTLSMPAKSLAASHPKSLLLTLQTQFSVFRVRGC